MPCSLVCCFQATIHSIFLSFVFFIREAYKQFDAERGVGVDPRFPYSIAVTLILCLFFNALFESLGQRFIFHIAGQLRAAVCGLIFEKTLQLNAATQIDSGRVLTLVSTDARSKLRTKLTAETFQPIRVVKFSGLEDVFISRTEKARAEQVVYSVRAQLAQWLNGAVMRALPPLVDFVVIVVYSNVHNSTPKDFVVTIIPHIPYLVQLILSAATLPAAYMLSSSFSSPSPPFL